MEKSKVTVNTIVSRQQVTGYTPETLDTGRKLKLKWSGKGAEVGEKNRTLFFLNLETAGTNWGQRRKTFRRTGQRAPTSQPLTSRADASLQAGNEKAAILSSSCTQWLHRSQWNSWRVGYVITLSEVLPQFAGSWRTLELRTSNAGLAWSVQQIIEVIVTRWVLLGNNFFSPLPYLTPFQLILQKDVFPIESSEPPQCNFPIWDK